MAEGYTAGDKDKFKADVGRMTEFLFSIEPYRALKDRFNVRAVFRPSPEKGMDEPRQRAYRKTVLNASFNAFDLDRYMLIEEDHRMHEIAGQVPYDALIVLVDSKRYGGGSIAFDYCVTTVDHPRSLEVFVHELGHSFGGLADEYYQSEVSYNDFYPKGIEPLEPNITALLDPANVKWKGPALARDRRPDRVRQGPDRGAPGRAAGGAGRPGQGRRGGQETGRGSGGAEEDRGQGRGRARRRSGPRSRPSARSTPPWSTRSASSRGPVTRPRGSTGRRSTAS